MYGNSMKETLLLTYRETLVLMECSRKHLLLVFLDLITDTDVDMPLSSSSSMAYHKPYIHTASTLTTYKLIL